IHAYLFLPYKACGPQSLPVSCAFQFLLISHGGLDCHKYKVRETHFSVRRVRSNAAIVDNQTHPKRSL
ncbi:hypothetical protein ACFLZI_04100, partial [Nitrospirota bacterium]